MPKHLAPLREANQENRFKDNHHPATQSRGWGRTKGEVQDHTRALDGKAPKAQNAVMPAPSANARGGQTQLPSTPALHLPHPQSNL